MKASSRAAIILLVLSLVMTGCFGEDYSFCPPDERAVTLHFRLPDPATRATDTFKEEISTATTAIYDSVGNLVQAIVTSEADHAEFQGLRLTLAPGTYRVVSWGNSTSGTKINALNTHYSVPKWLDYLHISAEGRMVGNSDPLFYAPNTKGGEYELTVDPVTGHEGTLNFRHAHRNVEIFVTGFVGSDNSTTPLVRLTGLPAGLEFLGMDAIDEPEVGSQLGSSRIRVEQSEYALSAFTTFYFGLADYEIGVELLDPATEEVVFATTLNEHIDTDTPETERTLRLLIDLSKINVEVGVTIPKWGENDVEYDYNR